MTTFPNSPRLLKGGIVLIDPDSGAVRRVIALQYNPDTLTRTLQPKTPGESANRSEALRLEGSAGGDDQAGRRDRRDGSA